MADLNPGFKSPCLIFQADLTLKPVHTACLKTRENIPLKSFLKPKLAAKLDNLMLKTVKNSNSDTICIIETILAI